jgi:hypothetical protein
MPIGARWAVKDLPEPGVAALEIEREASDEPQRDTWRIRVDDRRQVRR